MILLNISHQGKYVDLDFEAVRSKFLKQCQKSFFTEFLLLFDSNS